MSFHDIRLPEKYSRGATGGPMFSTTVVTTDSGWEQRNENWADPLGEWEIGFLIRTPDDVQQILRFFYGRRGQAYGFRFKWWQDYRALQQPLGTGNGTQTQFQLIRDYDDPVFPYRKSVTKPVDGTVIVYADGMVTSGWTVDPATGLVTFTDPPADNAVLTADFEFDWPVRFKSDVQKSVYESIAAGSIPNIELKEIRE